MGLSVFMNVPLRGWFGLTCNITEVPHPEKTSGLRCIKIEWHAPGERPATRLSVVNFNKDKGLLGEKSVEWGQESHRGDGVGPCPCSFEMVRAILIHRIDMNHPQGHLEIDNVCKTSFIPNEDTLQAWDQHIGNTLDWAMKHTIA